MRQPLLLKLIQNNWRKHWKQVSRKDVEGIAISQVAAFHRVLVHAGTREQTPFFAPVTSKHVSDKICSEGNGSLVQLKESTLKPSKRMIPKYAKELSSSAQSSLKASK